MEENTQAQRALQGQLRTVERLYQLTSRLGRSLGLDEVCEAAVDAIVGLAGAQRASVLVFDETGFMRFRAWRGLSDAYRSAVDGHSPWMVDAKDPTCITIEDVLTDSTLRDLREVVLAEGIRALAFVPILYQGRLLGKFMLYHDAPHQFSSEELALAATVAHHVAFGVARAQTDAALEAALDRQRIARAEADAARADAERANQAKDEFLAMLAHELRNPLGAAVSALAVMQDSQPGDPSYERSLAAIQRQTRHLARLLDDLLDVSRITRGDIQLQSAPLDMRSVIDLGIENQRHRIEAKRQQLSVSVPDRPVMVMGDAVRLQQVFGNILHNASKYTQAGGSISVVLDAMAGRAVTRVRDKGNGIAAERLKWIFGLFNQADPTMARSEGGLGIGLTVAKRLMELHGGDLRASSEGLGRGSEFIIELSLADQIAAEPRAASEVSVSAKRILVIEDNEDGREMLVAALRLSGHDVAGAASGGQGLETATVFSPDVVLVDIGLPDMHGHDVARVLREKAAPRARLIAITGYGEFVNGAQSRESCFDARLLKPVEPRELLSTLERLG